MSLHFSNHSSFLFSLTHRCYSYIGRQGGAQNVSIGQKCQVKGVIMHELIHALGRWHEQSRPDRDRYIRVNEGNIKEGKGLLGYLACKAHASVLGQFLSLLKCNHDWSCITGWIGAWSCICWKFMVCACHRCMFETGQTNQPYASSVQ